MHTANAMLHFQLDPASAAPAYRQLVEQVRWYLASGSLTAGDKLPSIRALARSLGVNPSTVVRSYGELEHLGVIERRQGLGVFVTAAAVEASERERAAGVEALTRRARALAVEARQVGAADEELLELVRGELARLDRAGDRDPDRVQASDPNGDER